MGSSGRVVLVAGAGDTGGRLARLRHAAGDTVVALRRRPPGHGDGPRWLRADLLTGAGFDALPRRPDAVVFCATPDRRDEAAYRALFIDAQQRLLDALGAPPSRWLFVSSTAVYGEDAGGWVDESTPVAPAAFNGRVLVEAERRLAEACEGCVVLRPSGIYGPGRTRLIERARAATQARAHWTNRVHVEDVAAALSHLLDLDAPPSHVLCSDDEPAREDAVFDWLRGRMGLPGLPRAEGPETGRRVSNALLRGSGWRPAWPDFRSGYGAWLPATGAG